MFALLFHFSRQKYFASKNYYCQDSFSMEENVFTSVGKKLGNAAL